MVLSSSMRFWQLDILVKDNEDAAYEVKSSTSIKDTFIKDAAIQYYTIINWESISLIYQ